MSTQEKPQSGISIKPTEQLDERQKIFLEIVKEVGIDFYMGAWNQTDKMLREQCPDFSPPEFMTVQLNSVIALSVQYLTNIMTKFNVTSPADLMAIYIRSLTDGVASNLEKLRRGKH